MESKPARQRIEGLRPAREFREDAHFNSAQQCLRCPERQARLQDLSGFSGSLILMSPVYSLALKTTSRHALRRAPIGASALSQPQRRSDTRYPIARTPGARVAAHMAARGCGRTETSGIRMVRKAATSPQQDPRGLASTERRANYRVVRPRMRFSRRSMAMSLWPPQE